MKKLLALLLAAIMVLSFAACSSKEEGNPDQTGENADGTTSSEEKEEEKLDHIRGTVDGATYTNDVAGITFTAPDGWVYYNDEEIAALYSLSSDQLLSEETAELLENTQMVYDMYCQNAETGASLNINFENIGLIYGKLLDEEAYLELSKENLADQLSSSGMEVISCELVTETVNGNDVPCIDLKINLTGYGIELYEKVYVKKAGNFMGCITVGALTTEEISQIVSGLSF